MLRRFLNGSTRLCVVEHLSGRVAFDAEAHLGDGEGRIAVVDAEGRPLGLDKSNRIVTTFDTRDAEHTKPLLDSTSRCSRAARRRGGCLPGLRHAARRSGNRTSSGTTATSTSPT